MMATKKKGATSRNRSSQPENTVKLDKPRKDEVGRSGVYPFTSSRSPKSAKVRTAGSWGQGERGGKGYEDHGGSELSYQGGQLLGALDEGGDSLAAHSQSGNVEIPPEEWISFFNSFSRQHEGWLASVKVTQGSEQTWEVHERPLAGISSDHLTARDEIYVTIDRDQGGQLTHPIKNPMKVVFRRDLEGAHEGIDITTANGTTTSIRFRIASKPETLDGVVDFQHETANQKGEPGRPIEQKQQTKVREVHIPIERRMLEGSLSIPEQAKGIVVFAHGSGSSRHSPRNRFVAGMLQNAGFATLLMDLLTAEEEVLDSRTAALRFDIDLLARRLIGTTWWLQDQSETARLPLGYFGASTGAAAALVAAADVTDLVSAVVSRGGRPDLAGNALHKVIAPSLLIVGGNDTQVIELNRRAFGLIPAQKDFEIVPGASHLFEEPGALELVGNLAKNWFENYLGQTSQGIEAA
jgi:putative phosphoribosyl transferase